MRLLIITLISIIISSCGLVTQKEYEGNELSENQLSTLKVNHDARPVKGFLEIKRLDSKNQEGILALCGGFAGCHILPGEHSIDMVYIWDSPAKYSAGEFLKEFIDCLAFSWGCLVISTDTDSECTGTLMFDSAAGHTYEVQIAHSLEKIPTTFNLVDITSSEQIVSTPCEYTGEMDELKTKEYKKDEHKMF